jgi:hypothetical protein
MTVGGFFNFGFLGAEASGGGGGGGGGGAFTPASLTGLIGWWDAKNFASLSLTGSSVNSVNDLSGNNNTLVQGRWAKPVYNATGLNLRPAFVFDSTISPSFETGPFAMGTGNTLTAFIVCAAGASPSFSDPRVLSYLGFGTHDYNNAGSWELQRNATSNAPVQMKIVRNSINGTLVNQDNLRHRIIITIDASGVMTHYLDGVATSVGTSAGNWISAGRLCIGGTVNGNDNGWWMGQITEFGVASGFSSAGVVAQLDGFLATANASNSVTWDAATISLVTLSNGNLTITNNDPSSANQGAHVITTSGKTAGKYYFENQMAVNNGSTNMGIGVATTASTYTGMGNNASIGVETFVSGSIWANGSNTGINIGAWSTNGTYVGVAVDLDNRQIWFRVGAAGNWNNSGTANPATNVGGVAIPAGTMMPIATFGGGGGVGSIFNTNFGGAAFVGVVPTGFIPGWSV